MRRTFQRFTLAAVVPTALALLLLPALADAQGRRPGGGGGGGGGRTSAGAAAPATAARPQGGGHQSGPVARPPVNRVYVGGSYGYGYPYLGYYGYPYWGYGWGWGWPYWYGGGLWGYPYWGDNDPSAEFRIEVKPKEAQVYVDGYYAGIVDDFDGVFQRLHVSPGGHELTLYLKGFRTVTQNIHVGRSQDSKIKYQMEPLAAGEANEPPPQPTSPPPAAEPDVDARPGPPQRPAPAPMPAQPPRRLAPVPEQGGVATGQGFGVLVIRVQPSGADVLIDGERWQGPEGSERLVIQIAEGSHRIEVRKEGFVSFTSTVQVRPGETSPLNVALPPRGE
jgi:hypothetical protein